MINTQIYGIYAAYHIRLLIKHLKDSFREIQMKEECYVKLMTLYLHKRDFFQRNLNSVLFNSKQKMH